jgi:NADH dehydrogenase FAD-containing subunit
MTGRVVVVGGGYAGSAVARALDARCEVRWIEPRAALLHVVSLPRALARPGHDARALVPYDRCLTRGERIQAAAVAIDGRAVVLSNGERVDGDVIVIATGSRFSAPFRIDSLRVSREAALAELEQTRRALTGPTCVVGGGAAGVEVAGELAAAGRSVRLAHAGPRLLDSPEIQPALSARVARALAQAGVGVQLGVQVALSDRDQVAAGATIGGAEPIDGVALPAIGGAPNTAWLPPAWSRTPAGRLSVLPTLQIPADPAVFALGDAAGAPGPKLAWGAAREAAIVAHNVLALLDGRPLRALAPPWAWPALIPVGPDDGAGQLPFPGGPVVGAWITRQLKGADLMVTKRWRLLGHAAPPPIG